MAKGPKGFFQACILRQFRAFSRPTAVVEVGRRSGLLKVPNMAETYSLNFIRLLRVVFSSQQRRY